MTVEQIFAEVAMMTPELPKDEDPYKSEEYQRFVESIVPECHCAERYRPCDGLLAGGLCDGLTDERLDDDRDDDEEPDGL